MDGIYSEIALISAHNAFVRRRDVFFRAAHSTTPPVAPGRMHFLASHPLGARFAECTPSSHTTLAPCVQLNIVHPRRGARRKVTSYRSMRACPR